MNQPLVVGYADSQPVLSVSTLPDGSLTAGGTLNITGQAAGVNGIKAVIINGAPVALDLTNGFSIAYSLTEGNNTITMTAVDNAGLETTDTRSVTLDTTAPVIAIASPADNSALSATSVTVTGTLDRPGTVQASVGAGEPQAAVMDGTGFSVTLALAPGLNAIQITASDLAGNSASVNRSVVSDTAAPSLAVTAPGQDISSDLTTLLLEGSVSDSITTVSVTVAMDGRTFTPVLTNGSFQQQLDFPTAKQYAIAVTATDLAGNSVTTHRNVIRRGIPEITWGNPAAIGYGTALGSDQLNATASVAGSFSYAPASGTLLGAGAGQTLTATFTPADSTNYAPVTRSASIDVNRATPVLTWSAPAPITPGTSLGAAQLNAVASVPGALVYTPSSGSFLASGSHTLSVVFTPANGASYRGAAASVAIEVARSAQSISFAPLAPRLIGDAPFELAATSSSGLAVAYASSDNSVARVSGASVSIVGAGTCTISATQPGNVNFAAAPAVNQALVVGYAPAKPVLTLSTLDDGSITRAATLNITGSAASQNGIKTVIINGEPASLNADNGFSRAFTLSEGNNRFVTSVVDNSGLETTDSRSVILDTAVPVITVTSPADNSTLAAGSATVTGYLDASGTVSATVNGGSPQQAAMDGKAFSLAVNLANGSNTVLISASDLAGSSSTVKRSLVSDTTKPSLAVSYPGADTTLNATSLTLKGTVSDDLGTPAVTVSMGGVDYTPIVTAGGFQQQLDLPTAKSYAIAVTAVDQGGNSATVQRNVIRALLLGDLNNDGKVDVADALLALQMAVGIVTPGTADLAIGDVAPLVNGAPQPDGRIDIEDAYAILKKAVGILNF